MHVLRLCMGYMHENYLVHYSSVYGDDIKLKNKIVITQIFSPTTTTTTITKNLK